MNGAPGGPGRFAIVAARFYEDLAERLVAGARAAFAEHGSEDVEVLDVPGAFELPLAARYAAGTGRFAGVACLGAVIRGETDHYDFVCAEAARGVMRVQLDTGVPCAFGVLTVRDDGAGARARGRRQARPGPPRGRGGRCDGRAAGAARERLDCPDGQGMSQLREGPGVRPEPQPLDGRYQAALRSEPAEGADPGGQGAQRVYVCTRCLKAGKVTKAL